MTEPDKTTHAIVIPWSISNLQTWCGTPVKKLENVSPEHFVASSPDDVTCPKCRNAMRQALKNLQEWVPQLPSDKSPGDEKEEHSYFCLYCKKTVSESEADQETFPAQHKHCGGELAAILDVTDDSKGKKNNNDS